MKIRNCFNLIAAVIILLIILILSVWLFISPKETFSEYENKVLAKTPIFSLANIADNSFMKNAEAYITDHFPCRSVFLQTKSRIEILQGKTEKNGVLFAKDNYLIQNFSDIDQENLDNIVCVINQFALNNLTLKVITMFVPNSAAVNEDKLPPYYSGQNQEDIISKMYQNMPDTINVSVCQQLKINNEKEPMFYRLDHHWTTMGAYVGYVEYCKANNIKYYSDDQFNKIDITNDFSGTMSSKASIFYYPPDNIIRYYFKQEQQIKVQYFDNNSNLLNETNSLYNDDYLAKKDKYSSFLNANQPLALIKNSTVKNNAKVIVVKDSYANCFIPFLTNHYNEIYVVDLRYYDKPVSELMNKYHISECLILYSLVNLNTDTGIFSLK